MNINPSAAASVAGTSRAAARGGEADNQAAESTRQQSTAEKPAGKAADSASVDAGEQTSDRHGNGRQLLDVYEHGDDQEGDREDDQQHSPTAPPTSIDGSGEHLDLQA